MSAEQIPETQTVAWIENPGPSGKLVIKHDVPVQHPREGEVLVKLECSGIWYIPLAPLPILIIPPNC